MTNSQSLSDFPDAFFDLFLSSLAGVPVAVFILAAIAAIASLILSSTAYGRSLYAVGLNAKAAAWRAHRSSGFSSRLTPFPACWRAWPP